MPCPTTGRGRTQGVGIRASDCTFTLIRREYLLVHDCSTGLFGGAGNQRSPRGSKPRSPFHAITRLVCVLVRREQLAKSPPHLCTTRKPLSTCRAAWGGVLDSADGGQPLTIGAEPSAGTTATSLSTETPCMLRSMSLMSVGKSHQAETAAPTSLTRNVPECTTIQEPSSRMSTAAVSDSPARAS